MPSTHKSLYFHLVFSTKERLPQIADDWRNKLHAYLGGIVKNQQAVALAVGGVEDHVHFLISFNSTHRLADLIREIKASSSGWVHREIGLKSFAWQVGYGAFTVSPNNLERVKIIFCIRKRIIERKIFKKNILNY